MKSFIDENLYSRQIAVYGHQAMKNLTESKVNIEGFDGSTLELCKNLILAGVGHINIICDREITMEDLSVIYYANLSDVGNKLYNVIKNKLSELNPYVNITFMDDFEDYDIYILVNDNYDKALKLDEYIKSNNKKFIWMNTYGLMGNIFCNFGNFISLDIDGEVSDISIINDINDCIITTLEPHGLCQGDMVLIEDVKGLNVNGKHKVSKVINIKQFEVDKYYEGEYINGGRIIPQKMDKIFNHESLEKQFYKPSIENIDINNAHLHKQFQNYHLGKNSYNKYDGLFDKTMDVKYIPVCGIIGSYTAQEVIKGLTNKYTPITQWFYYNCYDIIPENYNYIDMPLVNNDRYNGLRNLFREELLEKIHKTNIFIVGAGAIGCEHLKNLNMLGFSCKKSQMFITDMDTIEKSNLNRQFLFRNSDIGKLKADIAVREIKKFNSECNVISLNDKICQETESFYNQEFYNNIDIVVNALDNMEARKYVDKQCIFYDKPLFESGTMGTKGNTQVIIPRLTQNYGASNDPEEKNFPVCTIKNFPNKIEHTIHWARDEFEALFNNYPSCWNRYINNTSSIENLTGNEKGELINNILYLWNNKVNKYSDCLNFAIERFNEKYNYLIRELLKQYPKDIETSSGIKFWSGGKRCPESIEFNFNDEEHLDYLKHTSLLISEMFNLDMSNLNINDEINKFKKSYKPKQYKSKGLKFSNDDKKQQELDNNLYKDLDLCDLPDIELMKNYKLKSLSFEKDNDDNHHIDFIMNSSNFRAINYDIPKINRYETKIKAGKIVPAISTTTSIVSSLVINEMIKYIFGKNNIEDYYNTYLNLAINMNVQITPVKCDKTIINNKDYTIWDYYKLYGDINVGELLDELTKYYGIEIDTISYGNKLLISPMLGLSNRLKRLNLKLSDLMKEFNIELDKKIYELQIEALMEDEDYDFPNIKFYL